MMSKMNIFKSIFNSIATKVSTPLSHREGLGVGLLLLLLLLSSCGPDGQHARVKGNIDGINQADVMAYVEDTVPGTIATPDTIHVKRGSFTYDRPISEPTILTLLYPNFSTTTLVVKPGKSVRVKGDANRLGEIEVDGNEDNNLLTEFRKQSFGHSATELQREAATFIRTHAATMAALVLFRDHFVHAECIEQNPTASLLAELKKAQPESALVKQYDKFLAPLLATAPGQKLPSFSSTSIDGKNVASDSYSGKNLLIVFCAQYDPSFYQVRRNARELDESLNEGQLTMLFVSLDVDKQKLENALTYDKLPGTVIYDGKGLQSPLVTRLGMRYLAGSLLVGSDGKIKARDIPTDQWKNRIPALL